MPEKKPQVFAAVHLEKPLKATNKQRKRLKELFKADAVQTFDISEDLIVLDYNGQTTKPPTHKRSKVTTKKK